MVVVSDVSLKPRNRENQRQIIQGGVPGCVPILPRFLDAPPELFENVLLVRNGLEDAAGQGSPDVTCTFWESIFGGPEEEEDDDDEWKDARRRPAGLVLVVFVRWRSVCCTASVHTSSTAKLRVWISGFRQHQCNFRHISSALRFRWIFSKGQKKKVVFWRIHFLWCVGILDYSCIDRITKSGNPYSLGS